MQYVLDRSSNLTSSNQNKSRFFSFQNDGWSNEAKDACLGCFLSWMDISKKPFTIGSMALGAHPHPGSHTALGNLDRCLEVLEEFGCGDLSAVVQDTMSSSINTFDTLDIVSQNPCVMTIYVNCFYSTVVKIVLSYQQQLIVFMTSVSSYVDHQNVNGC